MTLKDRIVRVLKKKKMEYSDLCEQLELSNDEVDSLIEEKMLKYLKAYLSYWVFHFTSFIITQTTYHQVHQQRDTIKKTFGKMIMIKYETLTTV